MEFIHEPKRADLLLQNHGPGTTTDVCGLKTLQVTPMASGAMQSQAACEHE